MVLVTRAHKFSKLAFSGGVRIIILPCPIWSFISKSGVMSKSGVLSIYFLSLAPLGPLGLIGEHVSVTKVWGELIEANYH